MWFNIVEVIFFVVDKCGLNVLFFGYFLIIWVVIIICICFL